MSGRITNFSFFSKIPKSVIDYEFATFLNAKETAFLSTSSRYFNQQMKSITFWKDKLLQQGCDKDTLNDVIKAKVIQNYRSLYGTLTKLNPAVIAKFNSPWELFCLSGEVKAITYAFEKTKMTPFTRNVRGECPIHLISITNPTAFKIAFDHFYKFVPPLFVTNYDTSLLSWACWGGNPEIISLIQINLLKNPFFDIDGNNPLHHAVRSGSVPAVKMILKKFAMEAKFSNLGFLIFSKDKLHLLHFAAMSHSTEMMTFVLNLIKRNPLFSKLNPLALTADKNNVLHLAAASGSAKMINYILSHPVFSKINVLAVTEEHETILHLAIQSGSIEATSLILKLIETNFRFNKFNLFAKSKNDKNIWHLCALSGVVENFQLLLSLPQFKKVNLEDLTLTGDNLLHFAASSGSTKMLEFLLNKIETDPRFSNIKPNTLNKEGLTVLHAALWSGGLSICKLILEHPAFSDVDPCAKTITNFTALHFATLSGNVETLEWVLTHPGFSKLDCAAITFDNKNLAHLAAASQSTAMLEYLIHLKQNDSRFKNLNLLQLTHSGYSPLHYAAQSGSLSTFQFISSHPEFKNLNRYARTQQGLNVLHFACLQGSAPLVSYIKSNINISPNETDHQGHNAFYYAKLTNMSKVIKKIINSSNVLEEKQENSVSCCPIM